MIMFCRSRSKHPLDKVESFFWRSKWRLASLAIRFLSGFTLPVFTNVECSFIRFFVLFVVKLRKDHYTTKMMSTESEQTVRAKSSYEIVEKCLLQPQEPFSKNCNNTGQSIKQKGRKRKQQNMMEKEETVPLDDKAREENMASKKQRKSEKRPIPSIRFDPSLGHLPSIDKSSLKRCKYEGCPNINFKSYVFCKTCGVHLCFCIQSGRNCFADFHTIKN